MMKNVLLLGDSIRQNYQYQVEKELREMAKVLYTNDNGRFCQFTLMSLHSWIAALVGGKGEIIDVVHFNSGLWDVLRLSTEEDCFNNIAVYEDLLLRIYKRIRFLCPNAKIIYATTTPVIEPGFTPGERIGIRRNEDIIRYNKVLTDTCFEMNITVDDLWEVAMNLPPEAHSDIVHYDTEVGRNTLGEAVARCVRSCL